MTSVAKLKDKARDYERKEDWAKAVEAYLQVIQATEKGDGEPELSLYNRVGDLYLRLGRIPDAVEYYARAADHYGEAGLYNNAIALCNKALRYQPDRLDLYRKLGKLSAEQGFTTDARRWYLEYAEKLAKQGKKDEAFAALKEFADLSADPEIREMLAAQLQQRGETGEAVNQLRVAYTQYLASGGAAKADELSKKIVGLDPKLAGTDLTLTVDGAAGGRGADLPGIPLEKEAAGAPAGTATIGVDEGYGFGEQAPVAEAAATEAAPLPGLDAAPTAADVETAALPGLESTEFAADAHEVLAADLPTLEVEQTALVDDEAESPAAFDLPTLDEDTTPAVDEAMAAEALPGLEGFGEVETEEPATEEAALPMLELPTLEEEAPEADEARLPTLDMGLHTEPAAAAEFQPADEWGDFADAAPQATADLGAQLAEALPEIAEPEEAPLPTLEAEPEEPAELDEEPAEALPTFEAEAEPAEPEVEEPVVAHAAPLHAAAELDVEALIRSARARFDTGEKREALASLEAQHANLADANRVADAYRVAETLVVLAPDAVSSHQARVEYAFRLDDRSRLVAAYLDFAACLRRTGAESKADSVFHRVLEIDPQNATARAAIAKAAPAAPSAVPAAGDFIDLGGLLMDDDEHEETTRFVVAETVESGDEERDFADMLSQFRAKIAEHVPQEDTESHYDLGIAFKEMGLIDEAISEFQIALRGGNERLKVYEELGQCFMQKEQYNIAAKLLTRGAQLPAKDDAELLGVYYLLGRCYEELGQKGEAKEAYERVLGLDIDFRDVNQRLARL